MNIFPKLYKIEISRAWWSGTISSEITMTPRYYWTGQKYYKWLTFEFKKKLIEDIDFWITGKCIDFKNIPKKNVEINIIY